jgi:hypothetical protein
MPFPTSTYGQPNSSDYYVNLASLPGGSLAGGGPQLGATELLFDGSMVQFMQWAASTAAGNAATFTASYINNAFQITPTTAANQWVSHVNDRAGGGLGTSNQTLALNSYAWGTVSGTTYPLTLNGTTAFKFTVSSATTGQLATAAVGTDIGNNVYNLVLVGGAPAQSASFISK